MNFTLICNPISHDFTLKHVCHSWDQVSVIGVQDVQHIPRLTQKLKKEQIFIFHLTQMSKPSFCLSTSVFFDHRSLLWHHSFFLLFDHLTLTFASSPPASNHPTACPSVTAHTSSPNRHRITQTNSKAPTSRHQQLHTNYIYTSTTQAFNSDITGGMVYESTSGITTSVFELQVLFRQTPDQRHPISFLF